MDKKWSSRTFHELQRIGSARDKKCLFPSMPPYAYVYSIVFCLSQLLKCAVKDPMAWLNAWKGDSIGGTSKQFFIIYHTESDEEEDTHIYFWSGDIFPVLTRRPFFFWFEAIHEMHVKCFLIVMSVAALQKGPKHQMNRACLKVWFLQKIVIYGVCRKGTKHQMN